VTQERTIDQLVAILHAMFPATRAVGIEQAWCGVLGVRRDWIPVVRFDRQRGLGEAGGYVGNGVAAANLAARILHDLVLGRDSELTRLPWVRSPGRRREPEPLRWLGTRLVYGLYRSADRREAARDAPAPRPWLGRPICCRDGEHDTAAGARDRFQEWSLTDGIRLELASQGTLVAGRHVGAVDTDMMADYRDPKRDPAAVVAAGLTASTRNGSRSSPTRLPSGSSEPRPRPERALLAAVGPGLSPVRADTAGAARRP